MNREELNVKLYDKMAGEQAKYQDWLLSQPPTEILHHAYEYSIREDIILSLESKDLTEAQAKALLKSPTPLADVVKAWNHRDCDYMTDIWDTIESRANDVIRREQQRSRDEGER